MALLAPHAKEDSESCGVVAQQLEKHHPAALTLILTHDAAADGLFSAKLKDLEIEMAGEIFEALGQQLNAGAAGVQPFMGQVSQAGSQQIMMNHPQHAQAAMFGLPMLFNMLGQFHATYRTRHNL